MELSSKLICITSIDDGGFSVINRLTIFQKLGRLI